MKQSSIEWLMEIDKSRAITIEEWQKAKAMHRQEIIDAYVNPLEANFKNIGADYYNETFNTEECHHKGKYTYNKETFECHKCGLIVPNEYRFNTKEK